MASKRTRTIQNRRDRRKAKQSGWTREGRGNPKKVGHGGSGATQNASYVSAEYKASKLVGGIGVPKGSTPEKPRQPKAQKKQKREPKDHSIPYRTLQEIAQMLAEGRAQQVEPPAVQ